MFDFALEFAPRLEASSPPGAESWRDLTGPTFLEALREQLGLRLERQTGTLDFLVVDYAEEPSAN